MVEGLVFYDVMGIFVNIDVNVLCFFVLGVCLFVVNFVYFGMGICNGFKLKMYIMFVVCMLFFIFYDFMYLLMFDKWFN